MKKTKNIIIIIIMIIIPIIFFIVNSYNKNIDLADNNQKIEEILSKDTGTLILNYHTLNDDETSYNLHENMQVYNMSLSGFEEQINFIIEKNINVITLDELREEIENDSFLEKNIVITFDDIDETVYENAYPILKKNNIPFSLFIVTSTPGTTFDERKYASWEQIIKMQNSGLATIGLHTHNLHYKKDDMPIFLDDSNIDIFEDDLIKSIDEFEKHLGYTPNYFAYPYGFGSVKTDEVLMDHGIDMIFSLNADIVDSNTKKFYIPRFLINENNQKYAAYWLSQ